MIIMKEGLSSIVYHNTHIDNCLDILKTNRFELTTMLGTGSDKFSDKFYYMSFSRVKFGGYAYTLPDNNIVTLILDGSRFNQRYKAGPVDYWGPEFKKAGREQSIELGMRQDENEERIFTDDPFIPNAKKYIFGIQIYCTNTCT